MANPMELEFEDLLTDYSAWLDRGGYIQGERADQDPVDEDHHVELVRWFLATRNAGRDRDAQRTP